MSKANAVDRANALLDSIADTLPWKFNEITIPSDDPVIVTWRKVDGYPAVMPHPESQSMLTGDRRFLEFLEQAPGLIEELIELTITPVDDTIKPAKSSRSGVSLPETE